ncbi:MAG: hypothetical protein II794_03925 [Oscillospiraceae bacterium]|nr:hypothetical protein [Oscillospiraceae bacterium]
MSSARKGIVIALMTVLYLAAGVLLAFAAINVNRWLGALYAPVSAVYAYFLWGLTERKLLRALPFILWGIAAAVLAACLFTATGWDALGVIAFILMYLCTVVPGLAAVGITYIVLHLTRRKG